MIEIKLMNCLLPDKLNLKQKELTSYRGSSFCFKFNSMFSSLYSINLRRKRNSKYTFDKNIKIFFTK